jgi:selenocysteine lyase/cysteine desulfurase
MTCSANKTTLEAYFSAFRDNTLGRGQVFESPFGPKQIVYADWTASGRAYRPIETCLQQEVLPFVANTHTGSTITGSHMTEAYAQAKAIVKQHVRAGSEDVLLFTGSGMTGAVNKLQRIMRTAERPVVFVTHMEHHSNHLSWLETGATVEVIKPDEQGNVGLGDFARLLERYRGRTKIAAGTACSNVTGIQTPYHEIARMIHAYDGRCFVDFACSAPYADIDMHPPVVGAHLDAIYFSPHKFLGGPGAAGVLIFHKSPCKSAVPDQVGGGTVLYTNPWEGREYIADIEQREDGGTPPFLQAIKAAMCIRLKEAMGVEQMRARESLMLDTIFRRFSGMRPVQVLEAHIKDRQGVISFIVKGAHYGLIVQLLNDRFGIQTRGGCSCAGTYGHKLLHVGRAQSYAIRDSIRSGNLYDKPGWIRLSIHPTMTDAEIVFIMDAIEETAAQAGAWAQDYRYDPKAHKFEHAGARAGEQGRVAAWFEPSMW